MKDHLIINPIEFYPPDRCRNCGWDSIELFNYFGFPMHYHNLLKTKISGKPIEALDKQAVFRMRCTRCGTEYTIVWNENIPYPAVDKTDRERFLSRYRKLFES